MTGTLFERAAQTMKKIGSVVLVGGSALLSGCSDKTNTEPAPRPGVQQQLAGSMHLHNLPNHGWANYDYNLVLPNPGETKEAYDAYIAAEKQERAAFKKRAIENAKKSKSYAVQAKKLDAAERQFKPVMSLFTEKGLRIYLGTRPDESYDPGKDKTLQQMLKMDPKFDSVLKEAGVNMGKANVENTNTKKTLDDQLLRRMVNEGNETDF